MFNSKVWKLSVTKIAGKILTVVEVIKIFSEFCHGNIIKGKLNPKDWNLSDVGSIWDAIGIPCMTNPITACIYWTFDWTFTPTKVGGNYGYYNENNHFIRYDGKIIIDENGQRRSIDGHLLVD